MTKAESDTGLSVITKADRNQVIYFQPQETATEDLLSVNYYGWLLLRNKWKILAAVTIATSLAVIYSFSVKPIYEATVRISIDPRISSAAVGQESDPQGASDVDQIINTEMQIIQSDAALRPVAEQYHLLSDNTSSDGKGSDGKSVASKSSESKSNGTKSDGHAVSSPPPTSKSTKASKDNKDSEDKALFEAPVSLSNLIVAHPPNSLLIDISYRSVDRQKAALVANAVAQSYITLGMETRARYSMSLSAFMERQIEELKKNMQTSSLALAGYEHKLGVINPNEKTSMVAARLLQLQSEYTDAQNDRIQKETEFLALQPKSFTPLSGAALEVSPQGGLLGQQQAQVRAAEEKLALVKTIYGVKHFEYKRAANDLDEVTRQYEQMRIEASKRIQVAYQESLNRERLLRESLALAKQESDELDANSAQYEELKREADADKNLYEELFRKIKEAGVNAGFQGSSIRITNQARPPRQPVFPKKGLFAGLAFILSFFISVLAVVLADMFDNTLRNPEQARRLVGCDVVGTLPRVRSFPPAGWLLEPEDLGGSSAQPTLLQRMTKSGDYFETSTYYRESISILLSTVLHNRSSAKPHSILITSPGAGDGKSSCAAHLALAHANLGKRTLLIDGDMRIPFQHRFFRLNNEVGLGGAIASSLPLQKICQRVQGPGASFDVVVAGPASRYTFSQVGRKIEELLEQAVKDYDLVIVDAPPMVGLSDPVQIACATESVLIIGHASRTSKQAIAGVVSTLHRVNANVVGVVLNQVRMDMSRSYSRYTVYAQHAGQLAE